MRAEVTLNELLASSPPENPEEVDGDASASHHRFQGQLDYQELRWMKWRVLRRRRAADPVLLDGGRFHPTRSPFSQFLTPHSFRFRVGKYQVYGRKLYRVRYVPLVLFSSSHHRTSHGQHIARAEVFLGSAVSG